MAEKLRFAEKNKSPSRLIHDLPGHMVSTQVHKRFHESDDNAGTDALNSGVYITETAVRAASKAQQKKRIKQEYAQAKRNSQETARASEIAGKAAMTLQEKARQIVAYVANHKGIFIIIGCILAVLLIFTSLISSCSVIVQIGTTNMEAYLRKMAIDGYILKLDLPELKEMISLLRRTSNNLNQIAKRVNQNGRLYGEDMGDILQKQERLWQAANEIQGKLAAM